MVRTLHASGIEVILDVVYNHTAEGNQLGPTLSLAVSTTPRTTGWRRRPRYDMDFTGCGNTLNIGIRGRSSRSWTRCGTG